MWCSSRCLSWLADSLPTTRCFSCCVPFTALAWAGGGGGGRRWRRRVGCGSVAGDGECAKAVARRAFGSGAERVFDRISAGGGGCALCAAALGMARHVLGGRHSGAARVLYTLPGEGISGVEAASRAHGGFNPENSERALEDIFLSGPVDDAHDVLVPRNTRSLSALLAGSASIVDGDDLLRGYRI